MFEKRARRRLYGPKREGMKRDRRQLHNEKLHNLRSPPSIIRMIKSRRMRWTGHVALMSEKSNAYRIFVANPEGKRTLGRIRRRWENNNKINLRKLEEIAMDWYDLAQDRNQWKTFVKKKTNLRIP
jgi:hypothetical protein